MTTKAHKLLTGTDLHEPKGVAAAPAGQVYVSDGAGSGVWTTITTAVSFSTGDLKTTWKTVADSGWLMLDDSTIGSATSGAVHNFSSLQSLFLLIWNNIPASLTTVSGGRGGSAAADWAANKTITLPKVLSRSMGISGAGAGLTTRLLGFSGGLETTTLVSTNVPTLTSVNAAQSITTSMPAGAGFPYSTLNDITAVSANLSGGANILIYSPGNHWSNATSMTANNSISTTYTNGSPTAFNIIGPITYVNMMVKL